TRDEARYKHQTNKILWIEHASLAAIQQSLSAVYELGEVETSDICRQYLLSYGLIGHAQAKQRRKRLGELLRIGHTNGKQLLKRLKMFQITKEELEDVLLLIKQE